MPYNRTCSRKVRATNLILSSSSVWPCHTEGQLESLRFDGRVYLPWDELNESINKKDGILVFNGALIDGKSFSQTKFKASFGYSTSSLIYRSDAYYNFVIENIGRDITLLTHQLGFVDQARCMSDLHTVGFVNYETPLCFLKDIILYISLGVIVGVVIIKFILAVFFAFAVGPESGIRKGETIYDVKPIISMGRKDMSTDEFINEEEEIDGELILANCRFRAKRFWRA